MTVSMRFLASCWSPAIRPKAASSVTGQVPKCDGISTATRIFRQTMEFFMRVSSFAKLRPAAISTISNCGLVTNFEEQNETIRCLSSGTGSSADVGRVYSECPWHYRPIHSSARDGGAGRSAQPCSRDDVGCTRCRTPGRAGAHLGSLPAPGSPGALRVSRAGNSRVALVLAFGRHTRVHGPTHQLLEEHGHMGWSALYCGERWSA